MQIVEIMKNSGEFYDIGRKTDHLVFIWNINSLKGLPLEKWPPFFIADLPKTLCNDFTFEF